jgi:hypothetical protein
MRVLSATSPDQSLAGAGRWATRTCWAAFGAMACGEARPWASGRRGDAAAPAGCAAGWATTGAAAAGSATGAAKGFSDQTRWSMDGVSTLAAWAAVVSAAAAAAAAAALRVTAVALAG